MNPLNRHLPYIEFDQHLRERQRMLARQQNPLRIWLARYRGHLWPLYSAMALLLMAGILSLIIIHDLGLGR